MQDKRLENIPQFVDIQSAASMLGLKSAWSLRSWLWQGRFASYKIGRRRIISVEDIERFISEARCEAREP